MDAVALAATIGGSAVGLAGVGATAWGASQQRRSAREIAALQHGHERDLARGGRLFDRRAEVYQQLLSLLFVVVERVELTLPVMTLGNEPELPEPPTAEEWRAMQVQLGTFGSREVADSFRLFTDASRTFWAQAGVLKVILEQRGRAGAAEPWGEVQEARIAVLEKLRELEQLISGELEQL